MDKALKVAEVALAMTDAIREGFPADKLMFAEGGLREIIAILGGDTQKETV